MVDPLGFSNDDGTLPKIAAVHSFTKTLDRLTRSELAMSKANMMIINSYRTLQSSKLCTDDYTEAKSWNHPCSGLSDRASESLDGVGNVTSMEAESFVRTQTLGAEESYAITSSTISVSSVISSLSSPTVTRNSDVSVRASSTHTSMATTTTTSTKSLPQTEAVFCSKERTNTVVTYCYDTPNCIKGKVSNSKTKSHKMPYKVVGKRYIDEGKFARLLWKKIKDMDFPLAFAEIISHAKRVDDLGIGLCRDRLLKLLKVMIQSKRGKVSPSCSIRDGELPLIA